MSGFDVTQIPLYFLIFQCAVIGVFVLIHFLLGMKRGVAKTSWFFLGHVVLIGALFWGIGFVQLNDFLNEEFLRQYASYLTFGAIDVDSYIDMIVAAGALPLVLAIADLVIKINLFVLFYVVFRFLFQFLIFGIPWLFIKPAVSGLPKQKLLGGFIGIFRGAFSGFIMLFPFLILINTIIGQGIEIDDPEYGELATSISAANDYNFVKIINDAVQYEGVGAADFFFDLAFRSKVNDNEVIIWRHELKWVGEGIKAALPDILSGNFDVENMTADDFSRYEGFFAAFAQSQLLNSSLKPVIKLGLAFANTTEDFAFLTDEELTTLFEKIDAAEIDLAGDFQQIYLAVHELLQIQSVSEWQAVADNFAVIGGFDTNHQELFISALTRFVTLDILQLADIALEVGIYHESVRNEIVWLATNEEKVALLDNIRQSIAGFNGTFISTTLSELVNLLDTTFYNFPGIDLDGDTIADITLAEFIESIEDLTVILNGDPVYHAWFQEILSGIAELSIIDILLEPIIDFGIYQLTNTEAEWTQDELDLIIGIIEENFGDSEDLKRELIWMATVYQKIGELHIAADLQNEEDPMFIMDNLLTTLDGQLQFRATIDTFLEGQLISSLTEQMSDVLIKKYLTEPLELTEPLYRAVDLDIFNLNDEINLVLDVIFGLYDSGLLLQEVTSEDADMFSVLLPILVEYVREPENKETLLSSNILYSFIDYNLTGIDGFSIPNVALESAGLYAGWIKKTELEVVFDIFDGLLEEMDNQDVNVADIFGSEDMFNLLYPIIKGYVQTEENRDMLLSSDILYFTLDEQLKALDAFEIPETAIVDDVDDPYHEWIQRLELKKLLHAIVILDLDLPEGNEALDLAGVTGSTLNEVIVLESLIITRVITTQLKEADLFEIPEPAFTNLSMLDLKQTELAALGDLLEDLDLDLGVLSTDGGADNLLDDIVVENLTSMSYEESYIIRGFITYGIREGIGEPHELAMNTEYTSILSNEEIEELFKVLNALDSVPSMSLTELTDTMTPETLTFAKVNEIIDAGDSIVIRALISENLLTVDQISELNLKDDAFHVHEGNPVYDLISYNEMKNMVAAMNHLADSDDDPVIDLVDTLDVDAITMGDVENMISEGSSIIKTLVSTQIQDMEDFEIHPDAIVDGEITQIDLEDLFRSLSAGLGSDTTIGDMATMATDLSIADLRLIEAEDSKIVKYMMTEMIIDNIGEDYDRTAARDFIDPLVLSSLEFVAIFDALAVLDPTEANPIADVAEGLDDLTVGDIGEITGKGSHILRARLSEELINNLGAEKIHPNAIDENNDITQLDLDDLFAALNHLGADKLVSELGDIASTITIGQARLMNDEGSLIVDGMVSQMIIENIGEDNVRSHAYDVADLTLGYDDMFGLIDGAELDRLFDALYILSDSDDDALLLNLTDSLSNTEALTVGRLADTVAQESVILNSLISKEMIPILGIDDVHPETLEDNATPGTITPTAEITRLDMTELMIALLVLGPETTLDEVGTMLSDTLSVPTIQAMREEDSLIIEGKISRIIRGAVIDQNYPIRDNAFFDASDVVLGALAFGLIDPAETTRLLDALNEIDGGSGSPITALVAEFDPNTITTEKLMLTVDKDSIIIRTMMSDIIIDAVTTARVAPDAYDIINNPDLSQTELVNFIQSIAIIDVTYDNGDPIDDLDILSVAANLAATVDSLTLGELIEMHQENSLIMRKYMSEGIITSVLLENVREDAYEIVPMEFINYDEITRLLDTLLMVATHTGGSPGAGLATPLQNVADQITDDIVTPALLVGIANDESIIAYRMVTNAIAGTGISVPNAAYQVHAYLGNDLTQSELLALADAIDAFGLESLELDTIDAGTIELSDIGLAINAGSLIANRMISQAVVDAGLNTAESHEGEENPLIDIQVSELSNLVSAFIALGIDSISSATTTDGFTLFDNAQAMNEAEFNGYIDYEAPYEPLNEDLGLTIVKDFLIIKLHNPPFTTVTNREELHDLIFP